MSTSCAPARGTPAAGDLGTFHDVVVILRLQVIYTLWVIGARFGTAFHSATFENALSGPDQALGTAPDIPQEYALTNLLSLYSIICPPQTKVVSLKQADFP